MGIDLQSRDSATSALATVGLRQLRVVARWYRSESLRVVIYCVQ